MLSQKENEYLRSPESFSADYSYVLKHKIRSKVKTLNGELALLGSAGFLNLTDFDKITENSKICGNAEKLENRSFSQKNKNMMVGLPGFEPESIEPKSTSLDQASRQPQVL
jgi:hypothetical protein